MKFAAVALLRKLLHQYDEKADVFQIAGFGQSAADSTSESSYILDFEAEEQMRESLQKYTDNLKDIIAELTAGNITYKDDNWDHYKWIAGELISKRAKFFVARGLKLQEMFKKAKVFCGTFDTFNSTFVGRYRI